MSDYSMLDLFRQEVETQVKSLKQSLSILKQQPSLGGELDTAIRSLHAITGSAQLVEIAAVATLSETMRVRLMAMQANSIALSDVLIEQLLHAGDLLVEMSDATEEIDRWLSDHAEDLAQTQTAIVGGNGESMPPPIQQRTGHTEVIESSSDHQVRPPSPPRETKVQSPPILGDLGGEDLGNDGSKDSRVHDTIPKEIRANPPETPDLKPPNDPQPNPPSLLLDSSMMDLFRLEVEAQATLLNNGLLALETQPRSAQELEALMRAAHSIKGAARIVGLDAAVHLAHAMEDCFVAAQSQTIRLDGDRVDVLLRGVDLLQNLGQVSDADLPAWLTKHDLDFASVRSTIEAIRNPETSAVIQPLEANVIPQAPIAPTPAAPTSDATDVPKTTTPEVSVSPIESSPTESSTIQDRVVRVSADNLNRMMGLAGESLIEANWLPPFADALGALKSQQLKLSKYLEQLQQNALANPIDQTAKTLLDATRKQDQECRKLLNDRLIELEEFIRRSTNLSDRLYREVITSNMRPFMDGMPGFPRMVRDLARTTNKQVKLEIVGKSTSVDRDILKKLEAPLTHILRNAVDHGIELPEDRVAAGKLAEGTIRLEAMHRGGMLAITIADDGKGIAPMLLRQQIVDKKLVTPDVATQLTDAELMEFLFLPGFSMSKQVTELSGRGVGLDIAKNMAQEVGGTVRATSQPGKGISFYFQLPLTLSVVRTLLVEVSGETYAFPLARIDQIVAVKPAEISVVETRQYFTLDQKNIGLIPVHQVLDLPPPPSLSDPLWVVVISDQANTYGLVVDRCLGERELVVRPLDARLGKVQDISAAALMGDGSLVLIVDVSDLVRSTNTLLNESTIAKISHIEENSDLTLNGSAHHKEPRRVLVVDDSITVREMERKLLQNRGYLVDVAVDGMEGWNAVRSSPYDLVISDIDMPRMNGIELIKAIKGHPRLGAIPVIVVSYRDREDDRMQGLEAGADYYLTKSSFHDDTLIRAVMDLIGE
ncbi:hybrid sensor histidine kinase/response regulator [Phormidesmis priestleyi ULC007]|uniref:histidine kinase n=1 Tax=Phormidesmis priestleyi ULC007 TaxID=1920490 RepID=A0A2T1DIV8_9CYAN|nr:response regulator [Phormidesmis priestleyi]PSB20395.1 hybrid sensor histidine kinase/response regulator [Phormidesmis priestleyi ULC007]PZO52972.1 MAG: hybrid sensor histidine kinase/response regulator [Phormidesmis priestleyi]